MCLATSSVWDPKWVASSEAKVWTTGSNTPRLASWVKIQTFQKKTQTHGAQVEDQHVQIHIFVYRCAAWVRPSTFKNCQRLSSQHNRQLKRPGVHNISMWTSPRVTYRCHQKIHVSNPFWMYIKQKLYEIWRSAPSSPKKPTPFSTPRNSIQRKGASELRWLRKELQDLKGLRNCLFFCCIKFWKLYTVDDW